MLLWLLCLFQLAFADETLRLAVLEFESVGQMDPNFMMQLSDETRGGALDVFPPATSKVMVLTRENLLGVLAQDGKDASCIAGECAVGIARSIGARFVIVGSVGKVEGQYSTTIGVYDAESNDLLGQKSMQESSQVVMLGKMRSFSAELIERTLATYDEGRLGVRQIGGEPDTWTVNASNQGILEISEPRLKGAKISINGGKVCDMRDKSICRALVEQGEVTVSIKRQYCDLFTETVSVGRLTTLEPKMVCRFAVLEPKSDWVSTKLDGKSVTDLTDVGFGTHTLEVETACKRSSVSIVVDDSGIQHVPVWKDKTRALKVTYVDTDKQSVAVPVLLDGVQVGETPFEQAVSVCSKQVEVRGERVEQVDLQGLSEWSVSFTEQLQQVSGEGYVARLTPSGTFSMGCPKLWTWRKMIDQKTLGLGCYFDEKPTHKVILTKDFYMMESEVTQQLYQRVMGDNPSYFKGSNRPVEQVSWFDAVKFANKLSEMEGLEQCYTINGNTVTWSKKECTGWRLPTEAEWEYAARGGESYKYAGSNSVGDVAWYWENSGSKTHDVCGKSRNGYGLCDMSGNVWEWVWDYYGAYSSDSVLNPTGISSASSRVIRGGGWYTYPLYLRSAERYTYSPAGRNNRLGFRLSRISP